MLTPEDLQEWLQHPVSRALRNLLRSRQSELSERWCRGQYLSENPHVTQLCNAKAQGAFEVYADLLTMTEEDLNEAMDSHRQ